MAVLRIISVGSNLNRGAVKLVVATWLALVFVACGGGGGSGTAPFSTGTPTPTISALSPASVVAGQGNFTLTVVGTNFSTTSVVRWNGSGRSTTFVSTNQLTTEILSGDIASPGTFQVTVSNPGSPAVVSTAAVFTAVSPDAVFITTARLPPSMAGKNYHFVLAGSGGVPPLSWSISSGALPLGLTLEPSTGLISGTPSGSGTFDFTVQLTDAAAAPDRTSRPLSIALESSLRRNDNIVACGGTDIPTAISNGVLRASISPYGDIDTYTFTLTETASNLTIETFAQRLDIGNNLNVRSDFLDTVLELLDSNCQVVALNDDATFTPTHVQDSKIVAGPVPFPTSNASDPNYNPADKPAPTSLAPGTYYIRVRDYRGDGRPDLVYDLSVSGIE